MDEDLANYKKESEVKIEQVRKELVENLEKMNKIFGVLQNSLKRENNKLVKEIEDLKGVIKHHESVTDKAVNAVQSKCDKFTKEVSETHDKTGKEAVEKAFSDVMKITC